MKDIGSRQLAWFVAAISILLMLAGTGLSVIFMARTGNIRPLLSHQALVPLTTLAYAFVGAMVAARHPRNPIGWLFTGVGMLNGLNAVGVGYSAIAQLTVGEMAFWAQFATWLNRWSWIPPLFLPTVFVFLYFPTGKLPSRRWRPFAAAGALGLMMIVGGIMLYPGALDSWGVVEPNPFGLEGYASILSGLVDVGSGLAAVAFLGSIAALIVKFRLSSGVRREQMKWLVYASGWMIVTFVAGSLIWFLFGDAPAAEEWSIILTSLSILTIAVAATIAILRHRLYDVDLVINRTLVYGALSVSVVAAYVLLVGYLGQVFQVRGRLSLSLVATGIVAVMVHPLRERLQHGVNRLMYGERDDPYKVLSQLGQRLEATIAPKEVLPTIVEAVAQALKLPYAAIQLREGDTIRVAVEYGRPVDNPISVPLTYQGERIGSLLCGPRSPREGFSPAEELLLNNVAHHAGVAVHAVQLTEDLQRSRERLVAAREEERRRLRRDLHDGLGPELASMGLKLDATLNLLDKAPGSARRYLQEAKDQAQGALGEVRRIVYGLRPPALDELGLVSAVRQNAISHIPNHRPRVHIESPQELPLLPAAVEVAAYRIAIEAMTNSARHADASHCWVRFSVSDTLDVEVADDGTGIPSDALAGVGISSMRERAAEVGGSLSVERRGKGGTCVRASLPLGMETQ